MKAPFPWFGGKRKVAHVVWDRFGDVGNYVEPFFGSGAVLLERPHVPRAETVNDKDCYVANFWRALAFNPEEVAYWSDWPVNEADLHARHQWLVKQAEFRERMKTDPEYFDARVAGWWVWGICQWIGGGWCQRPEWRGRFEAGGKPRGIFQKRPIVRRGGTGVHAKRPALRRGGRGIHGPEILEEAKPRGSAALPSDAELQWQTRPTTTPMGIHSDLDRTERIPPRSMPDVGGDAGAFGRGVHACALEKKQGGLYEYFYALAARLRRVRVCCGDFERILGPSPTYHVGLTAVFLDPPYSEAAKRDKDIYAEDDQKGEKPLADRAREWAIANGDHPQLRIALCGYEQEHKQHMPAGWTMIEWEAQGGYSNAMNGPGKKQGNKFLERIWFSPHCLKPCQAELW